jgi:hypothetical protein
MISKPAVACCHAGTAVSHPDIALDATKQLRGGRICGQQRVALAAVIKPPCWMNRYQSRHNLLVTAFRNRHATNSTTPRSMSRTIRWKP